MNEPAKGPARVFPPTEKGAREPLCCPVITSKTLARMDWDRRTLYLWCKACKGWHEYDLSALEEQHSSSTEHIA